MLSLILEFSDVRRTAILNAPLIPATLVAILTRTRDTDSIVRGLVYSSVQQINPRQLTIEQREKILKDGFEDREPAVRSAAAKMVVVWLDKVSEPSTQKLEEAEAWTGDGSGVMRSLVDFLRIFDVLEPKDNVAVDALTSIFITRPNVVDLFTFPGRLLPTYRMCIANERFVSILLDQHFN